ncbi:WhiB family transcriptional regulator [Mycobacterium sp. 23]|uniref:WhiB family transcriptional regulator n=1 Tax=Mycobacterium sp. 23 TaxID=3400424 RepID=UPI003AB0F8DE
MPMPLPTERSNGRYTAPRRRKTGPSTLGTMDDTAACTLRPGLPWVAERTPSDFHRSQMRAVCNSCPIRRKCAEYAAREASSGFFAGVWIPDGPRGKEIAVERLKRIAGGEA